MQQKRFAWTCAAAGMFATMSLLGACDPDDEGDKKPDNVQDSGPQECIVPDAGPPDAGPPDAGPPDAGPPDAGPTSLLPLAVDGTWAPSGYMGDGEQGNIAHDAECAATRPGSAKGTCHKFTWTPGGNGWGGVWWQYPELNWGDVAGFEVPDGASVLSFYAWGAAGGETVKFMVGMGAKADGFGLETGDITLTAEPKEYTIEVSRVRYRKVVGGFGWVAGGRTTPLVLFIDDIQWR